MMTGPVTVVFGIAPIGVIEDIGVMEAMGTIGVMAAFVAPRFIIAAFIAPLFINRGSAIGEFICEVGSGEPISRGSAVPGFAMPELAIPPCAMLERAEFVPNVLASSLGSLIIFMFQACSTESEGVSITSECG